VSPLDILRTAMSSLGGNKLRTSLALLGIIIGVAAVISTMAVGRGAQDAVTEGIESLGTHLLFVRPGDVSFRGIFGGQGSATTLTLDDAYALLDHSFLPSIEAVAPELSTNGQIVAGRENTFGQVIGVTPEYAAVRNAPVASGQFLSLLHIENRSEVAVLGSRISETLFGFRDPTGQKIRINGRQFVVIGVLEGKGGGTQDFDDRVLVPITTAYYRLASQRTAQGDVSVHTINVQVKNVDDMEMATQEISTALRLRHRISDEDDFIISNQEDTIEILEETQETFVVLIATIAGISLLVGGIGIMNIMLVSVTERTREIGIRKAMGAKRRDIQLQFMSEATLLSLGGGAVGLFSGWLVSSLLDGRTLGNQTFQTAFSGDIAILAMVVSAGIGLFFGIYPAVRASRLHPIEALRYD
jgi:putative ABC transport system permease protein